MDLLQCSLSPLLKALCPSALLCGRALVPPALPRGSVFADPRGLGLLFAAWISFEEPIHRSWFSSRDLPSQLVTPSHFQVDREYFLCSCALNYTQLSCKILCYFLHISKLILASCSAHQEPLPPGLSPGFSTGVSLISILGGFRAFCSHFLVVSLTPAPCTPHSCSTLQQAWSVCPLQHCLWHFPSPTGVAVRDVDTECGTEAVTFLVSAVPGDDTGRLGSWPLAQLLQQNPPHSAVPSPAAGSRLRGQCGAAGSASLSPLGHPASAKTQPMLDIHWTVRSSNGCSQPLLNSSLGLEGQLVFQEKTVIPFIYPLICWWAKGGRADVPYPRKCYFLGTHGLAKGSQTSAGASGHCIVVDPAAMSIGFHHLIGKFLMHLRSVTFAENTVFVGKLFQK